MPNMRTLATSLGDRSLFVLVAVDTMHEHDRKTLYPASIKLLRTGSINTGNMNHL